MCLRRPFVKIADTEIYGIAMKRVRIVGKVLLWIVSIFAGLLMLFAGQSKFTIPEMWATWFESWGYPGWFMMFVGAAEMLGGLSLIIPKTAPYGAAGLIVLMLGALFTVVTKESGPFDSQAVLINLTLFTIVLWFRRPAWLRATAPTNEEYRMACAFLEGGDFFEGIRAAVIDKDRKPNWAPARLDDVDDHMTAAYFAPVTPELDLD